MTQVMDVREKLKMLQGYYRNISDEDLRVSLVESGFVIINEAPGQVFFEEEETYFVVPGVVQRSRGAEVKYDLDCLGLAS